MVNFIKNISLKDNAMWEGVREKLPSSKDALIENIQNNIDFTEATKLIKNSASQVANRSFDALNKTTGEVTGKLTEASDSAFVNISNLTDKANQVVNNIELASDKTISTLTQNTGNSISQVANRSFDALNKTTGEVTDKLTEASDSAFVNISNLTDKTFSTLTDTAAQAQVSLNETLQKTEQLHNSVTHIFKEPIKFALQSFISDHPILTWLLGHPLFAAIVMIVVILLFLSTINMIIQLPQKLLSVLLFSPLKIGNYLLGKILKPISPVTKKSTTTIPHTHKHNQEELTTDILSKLEVIKQDQENLIKQMNVIISSSSEKQDGMEIS